MKILVFLAWGAWALFTLQMSFMYLAPACMPVIETIYIEKPWNWGISFWTYILLFLFPLLPLLYALTLPVAPFFWISAWFENEQIAYVALAIYLTLIIGGLFPVAIKAWIKMGTGSFARDRHKKSTL